MSVRVIDDALREFSHRSTESFLPVAPSSLLQPISPLRFFGFFHLRFAELLSFTLIEFPGQ